MSTVHICLNDIFGVAVACNVIFYPEDTPFFNGSALAVSGAHSILIDADGTGSVTLLPGRYTVRFAKITGNTDTLIILVPNEEGVYEFPDLICAGNWVLPFRDFLQKTNNLADVADAAAAFEALKQPATAEASGVVRLATQAEVDAGSDVEKCVTPATLANAAFLAPGGGGSTNAAYLLKTTSFTADALKAYALDTTDEAMTVTLPANPATGDSISFADARGTWDRNPVTFVAGKIEGANISYVDLAQGTSLVFLYIDAAMGWRILESGTKPHNLTLPTIAGYSVGGAVTSTNGLWTGAPTAYAYAWQISNDGLTGWTDIAGATSATYTPVAGDLGKFVRVAVTATNSNGSSLRAISASSAAIVQPVFPPGAIAYWKLEETSGSRVDATGNGNDLSDNNSVGYAFGKFGNAASFDGSLQYLSAQMDLSDAASYTIVCWSKANVTSGVLPLITTGSGGPQIYCYHNDVGGFPFWNPDGFTPITIDVDTLDGNAHFFAGRFDGATGSAIFNCDAIRTAQENSGYSFSSNQMVNVGATPEASESFEGWIDCLAIWPRALSDEEIARLYNNGDGLDYLI